MTVIVVTGAGSGMGQACVEQLRGQADTLIAADISPPAIPDTVGVACDVSDRDAVQALAAHVREAGPFRALVHAAGISPTMGDATRVLDVDLLGTQYLLDAFEDLVTPGSSAVCFSSSAAYLLAPFMTADLEALLEDPLAPGFMERAVEAVANDSGFAYALAKVGVIRAAGRAAVRWGARGGRVNSLAPGLIDTPMGRQEFEQQPAMKDLLAQTPLQRFGESEEVAAVAAFLVSDAASFVNGIDVLVDGGQAQGTKAAAKDLG
ncbi:MAG TPA: SDR family oxidoreductase [Microthrixaceae bacterium]|nr:SDR family oxidoreductase [Microthrixaceae bacterium]